MSSEESHPGRFRADVRFQARSLLRMAGPLIANNLAIAGMNFADTVMSGRLSGADLAAVAVGSSVWMIVFLFGLGVLMAMSPTAAHSFGSRNYAAVGRYARQCLWLSQVLALVGIGLLSQSGRALEWIGIDPEIVPLTLGYLGAMTWGLPAIFAYLTLRFTSEGIGWTRPIMYMAVIGLVVNVVGNYVLMYGKLGFPALGAVGCGWASAITMWVMLGGMFYYMRRHSRYQEFEVFSTFDPPRWRQQRVLLGLGVPIGVSVVAEVGLFSTVALLMGSLGKEIVAGHQIAINYAATMFMVPLGLHSAVTILAGHALGAGYRREARFIGVVGIGMCAAMMAASALAMLALRHHIAAFYTTDEAVRPIAAGLLLMAAIFQIPDGLQVGAAGALRGFRDTRVPMLLNFTAYWLVGFPLAWYLGLRLQLGPQYVWVGLIAGLTVAAGALNLRFARISRPRPVNPHIS